MTAITIPGAARTRWAALQEAAEPVGLLPLAVLVGLASVQTFDVTAFGVLAPDIRHTFHLSNAGIDSVASLTGAVPIVFSVWMGYLGDRHNRISLSRLAALLWGVTAILTGLAPILAVLILARVVGGVGLLTAETVYPSLLSDYHRPERLGTIFTSYRFGSQGVGLLGAPLAGGMGALFGWRPTFVLLALPTFALVACLGFLREPQRGASFGLTAGTSDSPSIREGFREVRAIRTLRRSWLAAFVFGAGTLPFLTVVSDFFKDVYHLGDTARGGISALLGIGGLIGIAIGGRATSRALTALRLERLPVVSGILIMSFGGFALLLAVVPSLVFAVFVSALVTIGAFGFLPAYTTLVSFVSRPHLRAQAYGWSLLFYALGAIVITPIIGGVGDADGQRVSMALLSVIVFCGGLVAFSSRKFVEHDVEVARLFAAAVIEEDPSVELEAESPPAPAAPTRPPAKRKPAATKAKAAPAKAQARDVKAKVGTANPQAAKPKPAKANRQVATAKPKAPAKKIQAAVTSKSARSTARNRPAGTGSAGGVGGRS